MLSFYAPAANNDHALSLEIDLSSYVGGWHMLTVVHTEGKLEVYVDGVHLKSIAAQFALPEGEDTYYYGRLVEGGFDFPGKITEGELLNEMLTPDAEPDTEPDTEPTNTAPVDTPPATEVPTDPDGAPTEPVETDPPQEGCRSTMGGAAVAIMMIVSGAWVAIRKKET